MIANIVRNEIGGFVLNIYFSLALTAKGSAFSGEKLEAVGSSEGIVPL